MDFGELLLERACLYYHLLGRLITPFGYGLRRVEPWPSVYNDDRPDDAFLILATSLCVLLFLLPRCICIALQPGPRPSPHSLTWHLWYGAWQRRLWRSRSAGKVRRPEKPIHMPSPVLFHCQSICTSAQHRRRECDWLFDTKGK